MADFIFRVDAVQLNEAQQEKIATAIQGAVLTELARLDLHGDKPKTRAAIPQESGAFGGSALFRPLGWNGGMLIHAIEFEAAAATTLTVTGAVAERQDSAA
jgi:hypothetical protein